MVIFNSYVKLPEGTSPSIAMGHCKLPTEIASKNQWVILKLNTYKQNTTCHLREPLVINPGNGKSMNIP